MAPHVVLSPAGQASSLAPMLDQRLVTLRPEDLGGIIYALFHDCFAAIQQYRLDIPEARGERWVSFYNQHSRYLSLGIARQDLTPYLHHYEYYCGPFISILFELRALVVFPNSRQRKSLTKWQAETERKRLIDVTGDFLALPPKFHDLDVMAALELFRAGLCMSRDRASMAPKFSACARLYFKLSPLPRISEEIVGESLRETLSSRREFALIHDIFHALFLLLDLRHDMVFDQAWLSLQEDDESTFYAERVDKHAYALVLARNVLCGMFVAPTMLEADGAFALYVKPLIDTLRSSDRTSAPRARALWDLFKSDFVRVQQAFKEPICAANVIAHKPALSCVVKHALDLHQQEMLTV